MLGPYFNPLKKDYGASTNKVCYVCGCKLICMGFQHTLFEASPKKHTLFDIN